MNLVFDQREAVALWVFDMIAMASGYPCPPPKENYNALGVYSEHGMGGMVYHNCHERGCEMTAAGEGLWLSRLSLYCFFHYPFIQMDYARITALIDQRNERSQTFAEKCGCSHEGTHPAAAPDGGAILSFGMLKGDCKWIRRVPSELRQNMDEVA